MLARLEGPLQRPVLIGPSVLVLQKRDGDEQNPATDLAEADLKVRLYVMTS